ncbi:P-loop ATPase, Sll1717 family [Vibrio sinaloensis]|uniref:P-loop ATPase, Sll1717 family n=1 Tax=Photobacterium sp. (strain ATCC 43367) TaxID=379097 RepID=UPI0022AF41C5|nr:P-loop NTPase fold protein [Vibrio sinaloensis]MCZ4295111.1 P-loop NTPase fold protein [Vibrio sinaloensis]
MVAYKFRKNAIIGNLDAETDSFLEECFYESEVFKGIVNFDSSEENPDFTRRVIVGRTGSGKTALLRQIISHSNVKVHDVIEAENTVFEHINNNVFISRLIDTGVDLRVFYKSLWLHVLLVNVIQKLYRSSYTSFFNFIDDLSSGTKKPYKPDVVQEYLNSYKDNFFNDNAVIEITDRMQAELSGKLKLDPFEMGGKASAESVEKVQRETSSYVSRELLRKQKELIKVIREEFSDNKQQQRIVISVDDLDKSWLSSSEIRFDFINALLEAFKELLDIKSVKILISIRTDILKGIYQNNMRQDEKDQSLIYAISWKRNEIRKILDSRINHLIKKQYQSAQNVCFSDVFNFDIGGISADEFIINRTMLRPRDAIDFVNSCLAECDGEVSLNQDIILEAEEKFYSKRKNALEKEWKSIFPHIRDYLDSLSFVHRNKFRMEDISQAEKDSVSNYLLSRPNMNTEDKEHESRIMNFESIVQVWFCIGVIGIVKSDTLQIYSSFDKQELDITDMNKEFCIHPLFYRA